MRIEKLNENKIRIFLDLEDLKKKNINLHTFMSNSLESQDLFLDMLSIAESEVGFKTHNYKLMIEALASSDGNFILTITRIKPEAVSVSNPAYKKPAIRRQTTTPNKLLSIYKFNNFDEFCEFCSYINTNSKYVNKLKNSTLVLYKNTYYLILNNLKLNVIDLKSFSYTILEFASRSKNEDLLERKLREYGKIIFNKNAITTCLKYFSNMNKNS